MVEAASFRAVEQIAKLEGVRHITEVVALACQATELRFGALVESEAITVETVVEAVEFMVVVSWVSLCWAHRLQLCQMDYSSNQFWHLHRVTFVFPASCDLLFLLSRFANRSSSLPSFAANVSYLFKMRSRAVFGDLVTCIIKEQVAVQGSVV